MEFAMWMKYFEEEVHLFHREDFWFANLQAEIRRSWVKKPNTVNPNNFMLKFKKHQNKMTIEERTKLSKNFWLSGIGLDPKIGE